MTKVDSLRCDGALVLERDSRVDLLGKCGEPTFREERQEERVERFGGSPEPRLPGPAPRETRVEYGRLESERSRLEKRTVVTVERWTYDFGPNRFIHLVTLENGRIARIERGGYGSGRSGSSPTPIAVPRARCEPQALRVGATAPEVSAQCGPPASVDSKLEELAGSGGVQSSVVETWVYDFGPQNFTRRLVFRDGTLERIASGNYGYSQ